MDDISIQQLRVLREISTRGTISAAAVALGYTPSALSQQVRRLERSTGVSVLERSGRNVSLTPAGVELVRHADPLLAGIEAAHTAMEKAEGTVAGTLEIAVIGSVAATLLPTALTRLREEYPDLRLRTRDNESDEAVESLLTGEVDLAFTLDYPHIPSPRRDGVEYLTLMEDRFHLVVATGDPLEGEESLSIERLANRPFIASPPELSCGRCVLFACRSAGFEPQVSHFFADYPTTIKLVAAGAGIALVSDLGLLDPHPGVAKVKLDPGLSRKVQVASRTASAARPAVVAVRDTFVDLAAGLAVGESGCQ